MAKLPASSYKVQRLTSSNRQRLTRWDSARSLDSSSDHMPSMPIRRREFTIESSSSSSDSCFSSSCCLSNSNKINDDDDAFDACSDLESIFMSAPTFVSSPSTSSRFRDDLLSVLTQRSNITTSFDVGCCSRVHLLLPTVTSTATMSPQQRCGSPTRQHEDDEDDQYPKVVEEEVEDDADDDSHHSLPYSAATPKKAALPTASSNSRRSNMGRQDSVLLMRRKYYNI